MTIRSKSKILDHLGWVASMFAELGLGEALDEVIAQDQAQRKVSVGQAVKAMVLNQWPGVCQSTALSGTPLLRAQAHGALDGPRDSARDLNDDPLGRAREALYAQDVAALYALV